MRTLKNYRKTDGEKWTDRWGRQLRGGGVGQRCIAAVIRSSGSKGVTFWALLQLSIT